MSSREAPITVLEDPEQRDSSVNSKNWWSSGWCDIPPSCPFQGLWTHPSASKSNSAAQGSQTCPSKGTASLPQGPALPKNTLPPAGSLSAMTGWCRDGRAQFPCLGLGHFWRTIPASQAGISWDLACNLAAGQLCHLSNPTFLTSLQVYLPRAFCTKPSGCNSLFQSPFLGSPPSTGWCTSNRDKPQRLE